MILAMLFYGISFPATKTALQVFGPVSIVTFRLLISAVVLTCWNLASYGRDGLPKKRDLKLFLLIALVQPLGYFLSETYGLQIVSASTASVLIATIPVFTPIISRFFIEERLSPFNHAGLLLSFIGTAVLVSSGEDAHGTSHVLGILLILGAVLCAVVYTILVKKMPHQYSSVSVTANQNSLGLFMFLPLFFLLEFDRNMFSGLIDSSQGRSALLSILFLAIFASSLAFIFMNYGIKRLGPSKANGYVNLIPVVTAVVSVLFFGEHITLMKAVGMLIVFAGVLLSQRKSRSEYSAI